MRIRFWGTRGSIAAPGPQTVRYGGNTSCVELRSGGTHVVLDCGTGARALGGYLASVGPVVRPHLLLTHFHWDHIQGFPFFLPIFLPNADVQVYGTAGLERGLEEAMSGQMQYTYFPVRLDELLSRIGYHELGETTFQADDVTVRTQFLNHTCPALGYRVEAGGTSVAYMTDHEPFWPHNPDLPIEDALAHPGDQRHVDFVRGVDLLIHDSQYTTAEYPAKRGWGHSPIEYVVDVAVAAGAKRLALFHHDPNRSDDIVDDLVERARERVRRRGAEVEVIGAAEGLEVELEELEPPAEPYHRVAPREVVPPARIALVGPTERRRILREGLVEDGYRLSEFGLGAPLTLAGGGEPDLAVVAPPPDTDVVQAVKLVGEALGDRPVMVVVEGAVDERLLRRLGEMACDVVSTPFGPPNLRARVRAALARRARVGPSSPADEESMFLESARLADRLSNGELDDLLRAAVPCSFRPGEVLFSQGDPPTGVYYIRAGLLRIAVAGARGGDVTVGFAGPGDMVGEMSALDGAPRSATAVALEPVEASYLGREVFRKGLERAPAASVRLLRMMTRRLRAVDERLAQRAPSDGAATEENQRMAGPAGSGPTPARLEDLLRELERAEARLGVGPMDVATVHVRDREWRQAVHVLRTVARVFEQGDTREAQYRLALKALRSLVSCQAAALYLTEGDSLVRVAAIGRGTPAGWRPPALSADVARALSTGEPQVGHWSGAARGAGRERWSITAPLRAQGGMLGVLWLRRQDPPADEDVAVADIVATGAAMALERPLPTAEQEDTPLADLETVLDLELQRAQRLGYSIGVLVGYVGTSIPSGRVGGRGRLFDLADAIRGTLRRTDVVASTGTGDLGVILPGLKAEGLRLVESRVNQAAVNALAPRRRTSGNGRVRFAAVVAQPEDGNARQVLERAREALAQQPVPA